MRFIKNKFFIITLCIALILATSATVLSVMGFESPFRSIFGTIAIPFRWCGAKIAEGFAGFSDYFIGFDNLKEENIALKEENAKLREELAKAENAAAENDTLREYLNLENLNPEWSLVDAIIIGRESGSYITVYTLNRGSLHGIETEMPVITSAGVVGYVKEVGLAWCKVVPITETVAAVGAYIEKAGVSGLVVGDYSLRADGLCKMTYLADVEDIGAGDLIITSGTGNIYPAGLAVGTVEELVPDSYSRTYTATVKPAVDFENLSRVMIITSYKLVTETTGDKVTGESTASPVGSAP